MSRREGNNPINRIEQRKLKPINDLTRKVTAPSQFRDPSGTVKCPFCETFVSSKELRLHLRDMHPKARRGNSIVCEKCGMQINKAKYPIHITKCSGDQQPS